MTVAVLRSCISVGTELSGLKRSGCPCAARHEISRAGEEGDPEVATLGLTRTTGLAQTSWRRAAGRAFAAGIVLQVGEASRARPGDRVASAGAQANHAEIIRVPKNLVTAIPGRVSFEEASTVSWARSRCRESGGLSRRSARPSS